MTLEDALDLDMLRNGGERGQPVLPIIQIQLLVVLEGQ
jgi:hypothetical protein